MNRRGFLKGIAGVTAAGLVLPGEEVVRRFWRGWSPATAAQSYDPIHLYPLLQSGWVKMDYGYPQRFGDGSLVYWNHEGPYRVEKPA